MGFFERSNKGDNNDIFQFSMKYNSLERSLEANYKQNEKKLLKTIQMIAYDPTTKYIQEVLKYNFKKLPHFKNITFK